MPGLADDGLAAARHIDPSYPKRPRYRNNLAVCAHRSQRLLTRALPTRSLRGLIRSANVSERCSRPTHGSPDSILALQNVFTGSRDLSFRPEIPGAPMARPHLLVRRDQSRFSETPSALAFMSTITGSGRPDADTATWTWFVRTFAAWSNHPRCAQTSERAVVTTARSWSPRTTASWSISLRSYEARTSYRRSGSPRTSLWCMSVEPRGSP